MGYHIDRRYKYIPKKYWWAHWLINLWYGIIILIGLGICIHTAYNIFKPEVPRPQVPVHPLTIQNSANYIMESWVTRRSVKSPKKCNEDVYVLLMDAVKDSEINFAQWANYVRANLGWAMAREYHYVDSFCQDGEVFIFEEFP